MNEFFDSYKGITLDMVPVSHSLSMRSSSSTWSQVKELGEDLNEKRGVKWGWDSLTACLNLSQCVLMCFGGQ